MKNSNLIATVILAQAALIFIGFKIPDKSNKGKVEDNVKINNVVLTTDENPVNKISERNKKGEVNGIEFLLNYPILEGRNQDVLIPFNNEINQKLQEINNHFGFGEILTNTCDESLMTENISKQYLDYKVYNLNDSMISLILMKGDYFKDNSFPKFSFKTINYNLENGNFMEFEDFFKKDSKSTFVELFNKHSKYPLLTSDCQKVHLDDFEYYKNNFVIGNTTVKFYFDDCIICQEYNTEHAIEIPIEEVKPYLINPNIISGLTNIIK